MVYILIFLLEIFILFFISRKMTRGIYRAFFKLTKSERVTNYLYAILFLPGTFIHEVSHFLMALVLFVPVGQLEFLPKTYEEKLKLGSVPVAETDPIRRALIGASPFIVGVVSILGVLYYLINKNLLFTPVYLILAFYFIFQVGNTMFLSRSDLEGAWKLVILLTLVTVVLYILGLRIVIDSQSVLFLNLVEIFKKADLLLLFPIGLDLIVVVLLRLLGFAKVNLSDLK